MVQLRNPMQGRETIHRGRVCCFLRKVSLAFHCWKCGADIVAGVNSASEDGDKSKRLVAFLMNYVLAAATFKAQVRPCLPAATAACPVARLPGCGLRVRQVGAQSRRQVRQLRGQFAKRESGRSALLKVGMQQQQQQQ